MKKYIGVFKNEYVFAVINKFYMVFIGLLHSALIARYLGAELKGEVSYIQNIVSTGAVVLTFGIHHAYPHYRKKNPKGYLNRYMNSVLLIVTVYYIVVFLVCSLCRHNSVVIACSCMMPLFAYSTVVGYILLVEKPNKRNLSISVIGTIEIFYIIALMIWVKKNLLWGISAVTIVEIMKSIYFTGSLDFKLSLREVDLVHIKELLKYGFLPMIALLMTTLNYRIDVLMLKLFPSVGYAAIGVYSIGINISEKALLISDSVKEILLSKLARGRGESEVAVVMRICFAISIFVAFGIAIIGKPFISIIYGTEYSDAYYVTLINMCGTVFMVFFKMISQYNIVNKKQVLNAGMLSVSIILNLVLNSLLIPIIGINGAALGSTVGYFVCAVVFVLYFAKRSGIQVSKLVLIQPEDFINIKRLLRNKKNSGDN